VFTLVESEKDLPLDLYFDDSIIEGELEDSKDETAGSLWFVSLLSRVDGLVLMDTSLKVVGFGVEILEDKESKNIWQAGDVHASKTKRRRLDPEDFGTRHRSMMRYCAAVPGSVGFVISPRWRSTYHDESEKRTGSMDQRSAKARFSIKEA
jgi:hypothetical protein